MKGRNRLAFDFKSPKEMSAYTNTNQTPAEIHKCKICEKQAQFCCSACGTGHYYCSQACQASDWQAGHKRECVATIKSTSAGSLAGGRETAAQNVNAPRDEAERIDDMKFYMSQVYQIIKPVMLCIILSILWVKCTFPTPDYYIFRANAVNSTNPLPPIGGGGISVGVGGNGDTSTPTSDDFSASLKVALIILSQIIVATIVIVLLFKYGCMKILYGIFAAIVLLLLGLFGYLLGTQLLITFNLALDWPSFIFFLWNLGAVGLVQIFWKGPLIVQQGYLVLISSLMAYSLTQTVELTTWILLGLLAVWDLIAVLCPYGPLRLLVESSRDTGREIPALLYRFATFQHQASWHMKRLLGRRQVARNRKDLL